MSFSCSIQATKPDAEAIRERLEGLAPSPPIVNPAGQAAFENAKAAFVTLAADVASGDFNITGTISGHFYQEGYSRQNTITVQVTETTFLTAEEQAAAAEADDATKNASAGEGTTNTPPQNDDGA